MLQSFRKFVNLKSITEARGRSEAEIEFPVTQGLANMLSLIEGVASKARALNWFVSDGLLQASQGREELAELVNEELTKQTLHLPKTPQNIMPTKNVVGMHTEMARGMYDRLQGEDPYDPNAPFQPIMPNDLFSPEARQRRPELDSVKIDGKGIDEYYEENFEPKEMILEVSGGIHKHFDLVYMKKILLSHGLEIFHYGGQNGYIQFVEKGSYLPPNFRKPSFSNNDQNGIDLRPEKKMVGGKETDVDDIEGVVSGRKSRSVINFMGGPVFRNDNRAKDLIHQMRGNFVQTMDALRKGEPHNLSPEDAENYKKLAGNNVFQRQEINPHGKGAGRAKLAAKFGIPPGRSAKGVISIPANVDQSALAQAIQAGLEKPFKAKYGLSWKKPEVFGPFLRDEDPEPTHGGWYKIQGNNIVFKLNPAQQKEIMNYIFEPFNTQKRLIRSKIPAKYLELLNAAEPQGDQRFSVSDLINKGANKENKLGLDKIPMYNMTGLDQSKYVRDVHYEKIPVDPFNKQGDPILNHLLHDKGYEYELTTPKERKNGYPDLLGRGIAYLTLGNSRYRIQYDDNDEKFYLYVPNNKTGKSNANPDFGEIGKGWLGVKDTKFSGGVGGSHVSMNPAGAKTFEKLQQMLLNGQLGEIDRKSDRSLPYKNYLELPSIQGGITAAKRWYNQKREDKDAANNNFSPGELQSWAWEGLRANSGDHAFQVGLITHGENEIKWKNQERINKEIEKQAGGKQGFGIEPILMRHSVNPEEYLGAVANISQKFGKQPIIDLSQFSPELQNALGENALEFRKYKIGQYIAAKMMAEDKNKKIGDKFVRSGRGGEVDDEKGDDLETDEKNFGRKAWKTGNKQVVKPNDLLNHIRGNKAPQSVVARNAPPVIPQKVAVPQTPAQPINHADSLFDEPQIGKTMKQKINHADSFFEHCFMSYKVWKSLHETDAVYDPKMKNPPDGSGFNWWGAVGRTGGTSISGEVDTRNSDPTGKKGTKRGRKTK